MQKIQRSTSPPLRNLMQESAFRALHTLALQPKSTRSLAALVVAILVEHVIGWVLAFVFGAASSLVLLASTSAFAAS